jgi:TatD DNase family protein
MSNKIVDSHCHLNFPQFKDNLDKVVNRAVEKGVYRMLTISTKLSEIDNLENISKSYSQVYNSVGIHPHECKNYKDLSLEDLLKYTKNPKCVGIGETGLDFYYENSPKELQSKLFRIHIEASRKSNLPLIVHTRNADDETIEILEQEMEKGKFNGLIHCFSTSKKLAEKAIELGFYISLSGIITFNKSNELRNIVKDLPLNRLLVETDAPYLAPVPYRGKCNEPSFVLEITKFVANLLNLSLEEFSTKTTDNFYKLFTKSV